MPSEENRPPLAPPAAGTDPGAGAGDFTGSWKEAFSVLISSKIGIFKAEAKEVAAVAIVKIVLLSVAAFFLLIAWMLVNAAVVGVIAQNTPWEWYHALFGLAGGHCLVALVLFLIARTKSADPFPVTRAELEKDREWLENLKKR